MSKKDYEALAEVVRGNRLLFRSNTSHAMFAAELAEVLSSNPRMDKPRFIHACMPRAWDGTRHENVWAQAERRAGR